MASGGAKRSASLPLQPGATRAQIGRFLEATKGWRPERGACMVARFREQASEATVTTRPLTERQQAILDFIISTIRTRGFPPTLREIGAQFGIRSTKGVHDHLAARERKAKLRQQKDFARAIEVVGMPAGEHDAGESIPILGRIAAGTPLAVEDAEGSLVLDRSLTHGDKNFLL